MQLAEEKIFRIGVDWLSLHNFEIECDERIGKLEETTESYYRERILIEEPIFTIDSSTKLYADGTIKEYRNLRFNPNRILYEDNIQNADSQDIVAALKKLEKILLAKGIKLDITNATVSAIEINLNIKKEFSELMETLVLLFAKPLI